jgi:hypothetical protein
MSVRSLVYIILPLAACSSLKDPEAALGGAGGSDAAADAESLSDDTGVSPKQSPDVVDVPVDTVDLNGAFYDWKDGDPRAELGPQPWPSVQLTYCADPSDSGVPERELRAGVDAAAAELSRYSRLELSDESCEEADLLVHFGPVLRVEGSAVQAGYRPLGDLSGPGSAELLLSERESWTTALRDDAGGPRDLVTVALHALAHGVGMTHSSDPSSIMFPEYRGSLREASLGDQWALEELYGADQDADGFAATEGDCDDTDPEVFPGAPDTWYDGVDSDCDGADDYDQDGDGVVADFMGGSDCDDTNADVHPGAAEVCDGVDQDCDGTVDDGLADVWFVDGDGDGYGDTATALETCAPTTDMVQDDGDCDDGDAGVNPDASDIFNGVDDNCDGTVDEDFSQVAVRPYFSGLLSAVLVLGDSEFGGNGPVVTLLATLSVVGSELVLGIEATWTEIHSHPSIGELSTSWTVYSAPSGCQLIQIEDDAGNISSTELSSSASYTDNDISPDTVSGTGMVSSWTVVGDTEDADLGGTADDASITSILFDDVTVTLYCP